MCGIVGWIDFDGKSPPVRETLMRMAGALAHRGPDGEGAHVLGRAGLAARRLAIVDLEGGHQPMSNADGSVWIVFNGEVYNHAALRARLLAEGHAFRTRCDTEVLLSLYERHGFDMLELLEGPFAFAIWDVQRRRLFAARDRIGVRPLFFFEQGGLFLFASEVKALLRSGRIDAHLDPRGLDHLVHWMFPLHDRTLFRNIQALPAGHLLIAEAGRVAIRPYWDLAFPELSDDFVPDARQTERLADELDETLQASVALRMPDEVGFGAFLSGGVDSSLVAGMVRERSTEPLATFTATFPSRRHDESAAALRSAQALGGRAFAVDCRAEVLAAAYPRVVHHAEAPVIDTSCAAVYALARAVRQSGRKVVFSGEGADEAFGGYIYSKLDKLRRLVLDGPLRALRPVAAALARRFAGTDFLLPSTEAQRVANQVFGCLPDRFGEAWFLRRLRSLFSPGILAELKGGEAFDDVPAQWRQAVAGRHPLNQSLYLSYRMRLAGALMAEKSDRMLMAHSVEGRYPYLDTRFVELCARLPTSLKLRRLQDKYLLRRVAERHLPRAVAWRPKKMLMAPLAATFLGPPSVRGYVATLLGRQSLERAGIFDPCQVERLLRAVPRMLSWSPAGLLGQVGLVLVIGVQLWHQIFVEGRDPDWEQNEAVRMP